jgi:peptide deformylase
MKQTRAIVTFPHPVLRMRCLELGGADARTKELAADMRAALGFAGGIGLAAPQIGEAVRMILLRADARTKSGGGLVMIDPVITARSAEADIMFEGCLSLPGERHAVSRPVSVTVDYVSETGTRRSIELAGLAAKCVQHEIDHLDGILIRDRALAPQADTRSSLTTIGATILATSAHFPRSR